MVLVCSLNKDHFFCLFVVRRVIFDLVIFLKPHITYGIQQLVLRLNHSFKNQTQVYHTHQKKKKDTEPVKTCKNGVNSGIKIKTRSLTKTIHLIRFYDKVLS